MYRIFFSLVLSRLDAEFAHSIAVVVIRVLAATGVGWFVRRTTRPHPSLAVDALGLRFESPFGVAAGFDKEARMMRGLWDLGFGHIEVGTLTAHAQPGNPRPRLFRLVADRAVINRMGFNNHGSADAVTRLRAERSRHRRPIVGVNIGKSRVVDVEDAIDDYLESTRLLAPVADYLAVNVSSPNTPGLRTLQATQKLEPLLRAISDAAGSTPVLVKISPDVTDSEVREMGSLAVELGLAGIIATNTTVTRRGLVSSSMQVENAGEGGLSGAPLASRSLDVLRILRTVVPPEFCLVSVGGVESGADVAARLDAGATLVQGYSAFLYRGPAWARQVNRELVRIRRGTARA